MDSGTAEKAAAAEPAPGSSIPAEQLEQLTADIVAALKTVYDPEIPADIYELGLIYKIDVDDDRNIAIDMTLTAPGCPVAGEMPVWVENAVAAVPGVGPGDGEAHLRPALGQGPHVRRGQAGARHVLTWLRGRAGVQANLRCRRLHEKALPRSRPGVTAWHR